MTDTWQTIARLAGRLEDHSTLPREQRILLQLLKIQEESRIASIADFRAASRRPRVSALTRWR
ncbi:hypothetical protein [Streptomyces celluloflavus]|uniref:Transposase n=1 Tax=Streptomyces celluloflavus TaxID=58344 RepID=A0ABW7RIN9_9ACTN|nr:hypothetical protein OG717_07065 [Streptomyces celluloflavus]